MDIHLATDETDLDAIADVMLVLRTSYTRASLIERMREQMQQGYRIAWVEADGEVLCVAGFVIGLKLAWGRHIYVDDLVTAERHRSTGAGAAMIAWLKTHAREQGCRELHLDSGVQRFAAHRFYLRERFDIESHHFSIKALD
jgi:GNAT superfamily N-acetyltransferase